MQIVSDDTGLQIKEPLEMIYAMLERYERLQIFQVAYVVADESVIVMREAKSVFEFRAARQNIPLKFERCLDGRRGVTARPAQDNRAVSKYSRDRIIRTHMNPAVVEQEIISNLI